MRLVFNKAVAANTTSHLCQVDYATRAETGLMGDADYRIRVSPDAILWNDALHIDTATGVGAMPSTPAASSMLMNGDFAVIQRNFTGGDLAAGFFGYDRWLARDMRLIYQWRAKER